MRTKRLTNSEIKEFQRCRRKWWLKSIRGLRLKREKQVGPMKLGSRVHRSLEVLYETGHDTDAMFTDIHAQYDADMEEFPEEAEALDKERDLAVAMLEGYVEWLGETGEDEDIEVLGVEAPIEIEFGVIRGVLVTLMGKLDQRVRRRSTGEVLALDHKTVDDFSRVRLLPLDTQSLHYELIEYLDLLAKGADADAERTGGVLFNMLRKVKRTARAKPPFFMREAVRRNTAELRSYWERVRVIAEDMLDVEERGFAAAYPNPTRDCSWDCPYFGICPMFDDGSDVESVISMVYEEADPLERYGSPSESHGTV